jgi:hypothetical protein
MQDFFTVQLSLDKLFVYLLIGFSLQDDSYVNHMLKYKKDNKEELVKKFEAKHGGGDKKQVPVSQWGMPLCRSGMFIPDPGSCFLLIPDPGSKNINKREG